MIFWGFNIEFNIQKYALCEVNFCFSHKSRGFGNFKKNQIKRKLFIFG